MKRFWKSDTFSVPCDRPSQLVRSAVCAALLLASGSSLLWSQVPQVKQSPKPEGAGVTLNPAGDGKGYMLHVTTREVVVEVVARDRKNHPVNDLSQSDFEVFDSAHKSNEEIKVISGFRTIDAVSETNYPTDRIGSAVLPLGGRCEIRSNVHYELAFHPTKWTSGYHSITVTTTRRHITLSYRKQYYVGVDNSTIRTGPREAKDIATELQRAACYHSDVPGSLLLSAKRVRDQDGSHLRYAVSVIPGSLSLAGVDEDSHRLQLEYGVCTFSRSGTIMDFWRFSKDRTLSAEDLNGVLANGWKESVQVPRRGRPALARFVVLEPKSGNLGTIDLSTSTSTDMNEPDAHPTTDDPTHVLLVSGDKGVRSRAISPLGSPVPETGGLCGDVYELPTTTTFLPADFQALNAVGAIYTNSLNAPEQILKQGVPGSTPRSEWFGIDYYGQFWTTKAGRYRFILTADDGADLFIDDHRLINDDGIHPPQTVDGSIELDPGRHTLHMPYFQGPTYVNLILQIKPPGGDLKIFDVRDFPDPRSLAGRPMGQ